MTAQVPIPPPLTRPRRPPNLSLPLKLRILPDKAILKTGHLNYAPQRHQLRLFWLTLCSTARLTLSFVFKTTITMRTLLSFLLLACALAAQPSYDLILKGGHVIDPKTKIEGAMDVAISEGQIDRVAPQ